MAKYFVGGLSRETTTESLKAYFEQFGELADAVVMVRDGVPRGFGFITFANPAALPGEFILVTHVIDNKQVDVKSAVPHEEMPPPPATPAPGAIRGAPVGAGSGGSVSYASLADGIKKLFIGGLTPTTTKEMLEAHFASFGTLVDAVVMVEEATGRPRGFGFVTFESDVQAESAARFPQGHVIDNKRVDVKKAQPKGSPGLPAPPARGGPPVPTYGSYGGGYPTYGGYPAPYPTPFRGGPRGGPAGGPGPYRSSQAPVVPPTITTPSGAVRTSVGSAWEDSTTAPKKVFVGGLARETTEDSMATYFSQFGLVTSCEVMRRDGVSRGFGFVIFSTPEEAAAALSHGNHALDGRQVELKACQPRSAEPPGPRAVAAGGAYGAYGYPQQAAGYPQPSAYQSPYGAQAYQYPARGAYRGRYQPY